MDKHPIDLLIDRKINLIQEIINYLDELALGEYERFKIEKWKDGKYFFGTEFKVDLHDIKIASIGFYITTVEIYQYAFLMPVASINEIIEKYLSERMLEEIKFMLYGPEDGEQVEEIDNVEEWIKKQRERRG